jgi:hypothetical protein
MNSNFSTKYYQGYTVIPNDYFKLLENNELTSSEFCLLIHLKSLKNFKSHGTSRNQLSKFLNIHRNTIDQAIDSLVSKKLIALKTAKDPRFFIIEFLIHDVVKSKISKDPDFELPLDDDSHVQNCTGNVYKNVQETCTKLYNIELNREINKNIYSSNDVLSETDIPVNKPKKKPPTRSKPTLDFESAYKLYPRKLGKSKGLIKYKTDIKTVEDYNNLVMAINNAREAWKDREERFIPYFSSFMSTWRDHIEKPNSNVNEGMTLKQQEAIAYLLEIQRNEQDDLLRAR